MAQSILFGTCVLYPSGCGRVFSAWRRAPPGRSRLDGLWTILIVTEAGECDRCLPLRCPDRSRRLVYDGAAGVELTGTVDQSGAWAATVQRGEQGAIGTGRLSGAVAAEPGEADFGQPVQRLLGSRAALIASAAFCGTAIETLMTSAMNLADESVRDRVLANGPVGGWHTVPGTHSVLYRESIQFDVDGTGRMQSGGHERNDHAAIPVAQAGHGVVECQPLDDKPRSASPGN